MLFQEELLLRQEARESISPMREETSSRPLSSSSSVVRKTSKDVQKSFDRAASKNTRI